MGAAGARAASGGSGRWLVACEIDATFLLPELGNPGLEEFNRFIASNRDRIVFALNSGRTLESIALVAEAGPIARPDWVITRVGTEFWSDFTAESLDAAWRDEMLKPWPRAENRAALEGCPSLREQEPHNQHAAKLSYYFDVPASEVMGEVERKVAPWVGKGAPFAHLVGRLGIPRSRVIAAGDSGNDRDMLERGFPSIIVANHASDLDDLVGKRGVYLSREPGARGVFEGLRHFGLA